MCPWDREAPVPKNRKQTNEGPEKWRHSITHPDNSSDQILNQSNIKKKFEEFFSERIFN